MTYFGCLYTYTLFEKSKLFFQNVCHRFAEEFCDCFHTGNHSKTYKNCMNVFFGGAFHACSKKFKHLHIDICYEHVFCRWNRNLIMAKCKKTRHRGEQLSPIGKKAENKEALIQQRTDVKNLEASLPYETGYIVRKLKQSRVLYRPISIYF